MFFTDKMYIFLDGGRSSGKSYAAVFYIIYRIIMDWYLHGYKHRIIVARHNENKLSKSTYALFYKIISNPWFLGLGRQFKFTRSPLSITHKASGSEILFSGLRDEGEELKGYEDITGIWVEETSMIKGALTLSNISATMARPATANLGNPMMDSIGRFFIMSFNPNPFGNTDWLYEEFVDKERDDVLRIHSTYRDNPKLSEQDIIDLKNAIPDKYKPAQLEGIRGGMFEETVLTNWIEELFDPNNIPFKAKAAGIDWGMTEPNTYIRVKLDEVNKRIYVFDEMYETGLTKDIFAKRVHQKFPTDFRDYMIYADSSGPEGIVHFQREGFMVDGASKTFLEKYFLEWIYHYTIVVHPSCNSFKREVINWMHVTNRKTGVVYDATVDKDNHLMDAFKYACSKWVWMWVAQTQGPNYNT